MIKNNFINNIFNLIKNTIKMSFNEISMMKYKIEYEKNLLRIWLKSKLKELNSKDKLEYFEGHIIVKFRGDNEEFVFPSYDIILNLPPFLNNEIVYLDMSYCSLNIFPIILPRNLEYLDCSHNKIRYIPDYITLSLESLKFFNCSHNDLLILPLLPISIQELYFNNNKIITIPIPLQICFNLEIICGQNNIIPEGNLNLTNCKKIRFLDISNNNLNFNVFIDEQMYSNPNVEIYNFQSDINVFNTKLVF